jgi:hypothetical protein
VGDRRHAAMREQLLRLALAAVVAAALWPALAPGQGAPIPLLPPTITTPATPYQPAPAAPYPVAPPAPAPYQPAPAAPPYQSAPPPPAPYQSAPAGQDQSTPSYQEAPAAPPPEQPAPIIATPLAPPPSPAPQSPNATPTAPTASAPPPSAPTGSAPPPPAAGASSPSAQAPGQQAETTPLEQPAGPEAAPPQYPNAWVPETEARLVVLNKIDSLHKDLTVKVGESASYGALTITVQSCLVRPPSQPGDATAFLVISDSQKDEPGFRGWSLADEPWLSTLQNPVYDVWVVGCQS